MADPEDEKNPPWKPGDVVSGGVYDAQKVGNMEGAAPAPVMQSGFASTIPRGGPNGESERTRRDIMDTFGAIGRQIVPKQDLSVAAQDRLKSDPGLFYQLNQSGVLVSPEPTTTGAEGRLDTRIRESNPGLWAGIQSGDKNALRRRQELSYVLDLDERGGTDFLATELGKVGGMTSSVVPLFSSGSGIEDY
jgi:hypothetical protein